jgi:hypothetical protein
MSDDLYHFEFEGGPIDAPANAPEVFQAIGHWAASRSRLEQHINVLLIHINKPQYSTKLYKSRHPVTFTGKLELLKQWFNQHPVLKPHADSIRELTSRLKSISADRNTYLHSILESYDPATRIVGFHSVESIGIDKDMFNLS